MSMSDKLSNRWYKNFLPKGSHSPGKRKKLGFLSYGKSSKHIEICYAFRVRAVWQTVLNCYTIKYKTTDRTA